MDFNYTLRYRTLEQLLEDVRLDMKSLALEGKIDAGSLIKVARRCNYDLGLRVNQTREAILDLDKGRVRLPDDFDVMNFGNICGHFTVKTTPPQGTHIEEFEVPPFNQYTSNNPFVPFYKDPDDPNSCTTPEPLFCNPTQLPNTVTPTCLTKCGQDITLIQIVNFETRHYEINEPLIFVAATDPNRKHHQHSHMNQGGQMVYRGPRNHAWIKDGFLWVNMDCAKIYINYMGSLMNEDGEILVPDHPMLNEFYEYAIKARILENLMMDGTDVSKQLQIVLPSLKAARNNAFTIVNTPNFSELSKNHDMIRRAAYAKYYDMFKSYPGGHYPGTNNVS